MSTPTIHDNDRSSAKEFRATVIGLSDKSTDQLAEIIARHHAEERAAVEKAEKALTDLLFATENADETGYVTDVGFIDLDKINTAAHEALAALTALRNSSQSPTEGKT